GCRIRRRAGRGRGQGGWGLRARAGPGDLRVLRHAVRGDRERRRRPGPRARRHCGGGRRARATIAVVTQAELHPPFEELLECVRHPRGFDYPLYKRPSLTRRFQKRMDLVGAKSFEDYETYLGNDGDEFAQLFDTILINVTKFFRDPEAWRFVESEVIP